MIYYEKSEVNINNILFVKMSLEIYDNYARISKSDRIMWV